MRYVLTTKVKYTGRQKETVLTDWSYRLSRRSNWGTILFCMWLVENFGGKWNPKFPKYLCNSSKERKFWFLTTHKKTHTQQHTITVTLAISLFVFVVVCFGNCQTKRVPQCVQEPSRMPHNSLPTQQNIYFSCLSSPHSPLSLVT